MDRGVSAGYAFGMVTFCNHCGKMFVSVPRPGFLSLRMLQCTCGHSHIVAVKSLLDKPALPVNLREFPGLPKSPRPG